jgi:uncharacterized membrane protein YeaQ/YmgE (transglycosylase-associated protein family)
MMIHLLFFLMFGLAVGMIARAIHPQDAPIGFLPTVGIGVSGSFFGGVINWILGMGSSPIERSGFLMSILGGVLFLVAWRWWVLKTAPEGPRHFLTGKKL